MTSPRKLLAVPRSSTNSMRLVTIALYGAFALVAFCTSVAEMGCHSFLPTPPYAAQVSTMLTAVPYSPPPPRVERVPPSPKAEAVWVDGEWTWARRRWRWNPGRWTTVPAGAKFCPWATVRDEKGVVYMAPGHFCDTKHQVVQAPPPLAYAVEMGRNVVDAYGNPVETGISIKARVDGGVGDAGVPSSLSAVGERAGARDGDAGAPEVP